MLKYTKFWLYFKEYKSFYNTKNASAYSVRYFFVRRGQARMELSRYFVYAGSPFLLFI